MRPTWLAAAFAACMPLAAALAQVDATPEARQAQRQSRPTGTQGVFGNPLCLPPLDGPVVPRNWSCRATDPPFPCEPAVLIALIDLYALQECAQELYDGLQAPMVGLGLPDRCRERRPTGAPSAQVKAKLDQCWSAAQAATAQLERAARALLQPDPDAAAKLRAVLQRAAADHAQVMECTQASIRELQAEVARDEMRTQGRYLSAWEAYLREGELRPSEMCERMDRRPR